MIEKREQLLFFAMLLVAVVMPGGAALFCGRMGVDRALSGWGGVTSLCARSRGEPSSAHCEQRLSDGSPLARSISCTPAPECGDA